MDDPFDFRFALDTSAAIAGSGSTQWSQCVFTNP